MNSPVNRVAEEIRRRLTAAFAPVSLEIVDDSESHRGHGGHREGIETHFTVTLCSAEFLGKSRVVQQRMVYEQLRDLMDETSGGSIHALRLKLAAA